MDGEPSAAAAASASPGKKLPASHTLIAKASRAIMRECGGIRGARLTVAASRASSVSGVFGPPRDAKAQVSFAQFCGVNASARRRATRSRTDAAAVGATPSVAKAQTWVGTVGVHDHFTLFES